MGTELGYFKAAEKDFLGEKSCENALRILGWIKPEVMDGVEGVFVPILRSRCFEVAAEAFKVLNDGGYGYLFDGVIEKWKGQFGDSFLTEECRKIIEK